MSTMAAGFRSRCRLLGAQDDLVEAIAADAGIDRPSMRQRLQQRGPGLFVADLVAMGIGIAHDQDRRLGQRDARRPRHLGVAVGR